MLLPTFACTTSWTNSGVSYGNLKMNTSHSLFRIQWVFWSIPVNHENAGCICFRRIGAICRNRGVTVAQRVRVFKGHCQRSQGWCTRFALALFKQPFEHCGNTTDIIMTSSVLLFNFEGSRRLGTGTQPDLVMTLFIATLRDVIPRARHTL